jgi:4-diphosphocytidyl-2C-methyl-D-erythritol kinase
VSGIGDICRPMDREMMEALGNYEIAIFKPPFSLNTGEAYAALRENFGHLYISEGEARERFLELREAIIGGESTLPLFNTFGEMVFHRHKNLATLCHNLQNLGVSAMLTGSGSGFFCLSNGSFSDKNVEELARQYLGPHVFFRKVSFIFP